MCKDKRVRRERWQRQLAEWSSHRQGGNSKKVWLRAKSCAWWTAASWQGKARNMADLKMGTKRRVCRLDSVHFLKVNKWLKGEKCFQSKRAKKQMRTKELCQNNKKGKESKRWGQNWLAGKDRKNGHDTVESTVYRRRSKKTKKSNWEHVPFGEHLKKLKTSKVCLSYPR